MKPLENEDEHPILTFAAWFVFWMILGGFIIASTGCSLLPKAEVSPTVNNPTVVTRPTIVMVDCGSDESVEPIKNGNAL